MRRWLMTGVVLACLGSTASWAKKPKPAPAPTPVQLAYTGFGEVTQAYRDAYKVADLYALQDEVRDLGDPAPLQQRLDALRDEIKAAEAHLLSANEAFGAAAATEDAAGMQAVSDELAARIPGLAPLAETATALKADLVVAAASQPTTVDMADVAGLSGADLQRIFAAAGWSKEGAAIGGMATSGYAYENFDVERDGVVLNVYVIRPDASATGTGGSKPSDVAARATADTVSRYHEATDRYLEIKLGDGASVDDAKALLAQVVTGL